MKLTRFFYPLLIVCALLFAQSAGIAHHIAHSLSEQTQDQSLPDTKLCQLCAEFAHISGAIHSDVLHLRLLQTHSLFIATAIPASPHATLSAFVARGPPRFD